MRHIYELTDQTRKVFNGHIARIAEEMNVLDKNLYAILAGTATDTFAKFEHLYAACVRAGADVTPYDARLSSIKSRYKALSPLTDTECLATKIERDTDATLAIMQALEDGHIDEREWTKIDEALERQEQAIGLVRGLRPKTNVREIGRRAVANRRAK